MRYLAIAILCAHFLNAFASGANLVAEGDDAFNEQSPVQPASLVAIPFVATFQGTGSGTIGQTGFNSSQFTITAIGNTANRRTIGVTAMDIPLNLATINIANVGSATFADPTRVFYNNIGGNIGGAIGFGRDFGSALDILDIFDLAIPLWDMTFSIGPFFEPSPSVTQANMLSTNLGQLDFISFSNVTFMAIVVPESSQLAIVLVGFAATQRRRRRLA